MADKKYRYYRHLAMLFAGSSATGVLAAMVSAYCVAKFQMKKIQVLLTPPPTATVVVRMPDFWQKAFEETKLNPPENRMRVLETYVRKATKEDSKTPLPVSGVPAFLDLLDPGGEQLRASELLQPFLSTAADRAARERPTAAITQGSGPIH